MVHLIKLHLLILLLGVGFLSSCRDKTIIYPLDLVFHGPYYQSEFEAIKGSVSIVPSDTLLEYIFNDDVVYIAEISNLSEDTFSIFVSKHLGLIWCNYFCFDYLEDNCLVPGGGRPNIIEDYEELDTLLPNSSKKYVTWMQGIKNYDLIDVSIKIESSFFDSLNSFSPFRYYWNKSLLLELEHPVFLFQINRDGGLAPISAINVQRELDKSIKHTQYD